ncbi:MAG: hypothetical protein WD491_08860 [Balneolales bacterium]
MDVLKIHSNINSRNINPVERFISVNRLVYLYRNLWNATDSQQNNGESIYLFTKENNLQETVQELVTIGLHHINGYFKINDYVEYTIKGGDISITVQNDLKKSNIREIEFKGYISNWVGVPHTRLPIHLLNRTKFKKKFAHRLSGARATLSSKLWKLYGTIATRNQFTSKENAGHKMLTLNTR